MSDRLQAVRDILDLPSGADLTMFVVLSPNEEDESQSREYRRFPAAADLLTEINDSFLDDTVRKRFLNETLDVIPEAYIASDMKGIYEIEQNDSYHPLDFDSCCVDAIPPYASSTKDRIEGFIWRVTGNADKHFWAYQHVHAISPTRRKLTISGIEGGEWVCQPDSVLPIEHRIDFVVADGWIYADKLNLLENKFGYERKIRAEAGKAIEEIEDSKLFDGTETLRECLLEESLANAKRLVKLRESVVLDLDADSLFARIDAVPTYKRVFNTKDGKVVVENRNIREFFKMLGDDLVQSPLTGIRYDAPRKKALQAVADTANLPEAGKRPEKIPDYEQDEFITAPKYADGAPFQPDAQKYDDPFGEE